MVIRIKRDIDVDIASQVRRRVSSSDDVSSPVADRKSRDVGCHGGACRHRGDVVAAGGGGVKRGRVPKGMYVCIDCN